jgi:hypothetical protein
MQDHDSPQREQSLHLNEPLQPNRASTILSESTHALSELPWMSVAQHVLQAGNIVKSGFKLRHLHCRVHCVCGWRIPGEPPGCQVMPGARHQDGHDVRTATRDRAPQQVSCFKGAVLPTHPSPGRSGAFGLAFGGGGLPQPPGTSRGRRRGGSETETFLTTKWP